MSDENITARITTDYELNPQLSYFSTKTRLEPRGSFLKQGKITYDHVKVVNIYIVYEISKTFNINSYPTMENCLFGAVNLTKNDDIHKYKYSGYGVGFYRHASGGIGRYETLE